MNPKAKQDIHSFLVEATAAIQEAREVFLLGTLGEPLNTDEGRLIAELSQAEDCLSEAMYRVQRL